MKNSKQHFGSHEGQDRHEEVIGGTDRNFGFVFSVVFALVGIWAFYMSSPYWVWWFVCSCTIAIVAWIAPSILSPLNTGWTKFSMLLFYIMSPIAMGIIFFLCVAPIGLALRLFGKDLLNLRFDPDATTYWIERKPPGPSGDSFPRQF